MGKKCVEAGIAKAISTFNKGADALGDECAHGLLDIVTLYTPRFKDTKFFISLGLHTMDDNDLNLKIDMVNMLLRTAIRNGPLVNVFFSDKGNFMRHGYIKSRLIHSDKLLDIVT